MWLLCVEKFMIATERTRMAVQRINIKAIRENPWQTRQEYHNIEELAADIKRNGLLQKPIGREMQDGSFQLLCGHRRWQAISLLHENNGSGTKYSHIAVDIMDLSDEQMDNGAWSENEAREDVNPIDRALAVQKSMTTFGYKHAEIAKLRGMSRSALSNLLRLLQLPDEVQKLIAAGALTERAGRELLPLITALRSEAECVRVAKIVAKNGATTSTIQDEVATAIEKMSLQINKQIAEFADWGELPPPCANECNRVCYQFVKHKKQPRCLSPTAYNSKVKLFYRRVEQLCSEALSLPVLKDSSWSTLSKSIASLALEKQCSNLRVSHREQTYYEAKEIKQKQWPRCYYTCVQGLQCQCEEEENAAQADMPITQPEQSPEEAAWEAWDQTKRAEAKEIVADVEQEMKDIFSAVLDASIAIEAARDVLTGLATSLARRPVKGEEAARVLGLHVLCATGYPLQVNLPSFAELSRIEARIKMNQAGDKDLAAALVEVVRETLEREAVYLNCPTWGLKADLSGKLEKVAELDPEVNLVDIWQEVNELPDQH